VIAIYITLVRYSVSVNSKEAFDVEHCTKNGLGLPGLVATCYSICARSFGRIGIKGAIIGAAQMSEQSARNNAPAVAAIPPPRITIPKIPQFK
jgi:hypothetical protein